jgi:hypothetical protein
MHDNQFLIDNWTFFAPLFLIILALTVTALVSIFRRQHYRYGKRWMWVLAVLLFEPWGAVVYFLLEKEHA